MVRPGISSKRRIQLPGGAASATTRVPGFCRARASAPQVGSGIRCGGPRGQDRACGIPGTSPSRPDRLPESRCSPPRRPSRPIRIPGRGVRRSQRLPECCSPVAHRADRLSGTGAPSLPARTGSREPPGLPSGGEVEILDLVGPGPLPPPACRSGQVAHEPSCRTAVESRAQGTAARARWRPGGWRKQARRRDVVNDEAAGQHDQATADGGLSPPLLAATFVGSRWVRVRRSFPDATTTPLQTKTSQRASTLAGRRGTT